MKESKKKRSTFPFILALIILINPSVHVVDIFPDFIAYLMIAGWLAFASYRAPYFHEARAAFMKLAAVTAAKIPAFFIIVYARSQASNDNDIYALFAFVFAVVEGALIYSALNNLFLGIYYLGERSESKALIAPFPIGKRGRRYGTVEGFRFLSFSFTFFKCAAYALPEMLLLTRTVDTGAYVFNVARLYPYTILSVMAATLFIGIFWAKRCAAYRRAIVAEGKFNEAVDALFDDAGRQSLEKRLWLSGMHGRLTLLSVASIFTIDIIFSDFRDINLLPDFIFAILLTVGAYMLTKYIGRGRGTVLACGGLYALSSLIAYVLSCVFLSEYSYEKLATSSIARVAYLPTLIGSAVSTAAMAVMLIITARMLVTFTKKHTGVDIGDERYMRSDAEYHRSMKKRTVTWAVLGIVCGITKLVQVFLKSYVDLIYVDIENDIGISTLEPVAETVLPWFGIVISIAVIIFIGYSFYYFGVLKSDTEIKYSYD